MTNMNWFKNLKTSMWNHYGKAPAKMLIHTGVIGWVMSSVAQIFAIVINDKIPKEQKMFMIPQEAADAMINIISFYTITQGVTSLASKAVRCGKILPKNISTFLKKSGLGEKIGKWDFDVIKNGKLPEDKLSDFETFKNGTDVIATLAGSIVSCNIVTPVLRNMYASSRQQANIAKMNKPDQDNTKKRNPYSNFVHTYMYTGNTGSMKV